jgi:hypothetical protein
MWLNNNKSVREVWHNNMKVEDIDPENDENVITDQ